MLEREQADLAENGFVAFQIDYRNYARSTREGPGPVARPLGYPADLVNAVVALKKAHLPFADTTRIGLFGRSMGGGVVLDALVARPHLARAAVLYSPVSSLASDNYRRWVVPDPALRRRVEGAYGTPTSTARVLAAGERARLPRPGRRPGADRPRHRRPACARCAGARRPPGRCARRGKDVTLYEYPGEDHRFDRAWPTVHAPRGHLPPRRARLTTAGAAALRELWTVRTRCAVGEPFITPRYNWAGGRMGGGVVYNVLRRAAGTGRRRGACSRRSAHAPRTTSTAGSATTPDAARRRTTCCAGDGEPATARGSGARCSPRPYFDRITEPVLIHHGAVDALPDCAGAGPPCAR